MTEYTICKLPRGRKDAALVMALLGISLLIGGCGEKNRYVTLPPPKVTVSLPVQRQITDYLEFTGNTQAVNSVQLRARVEGYLEKVLFKDGDMVKKGQLLFVIQQNTYQAKLQEAEAQIHSQKARLEHAETEFARFSNLVLKNAASQTDADQWRYERDAAQAALLSAQAARDLARLDLEYTRVTAPFDGRINRRLADPGNLVGANERTVLAEINQINPIYVYFTINERDLLHLMSETGRTLQQNTENKSPVYFGLANEQGYPHEGRLDFAAISVNPNTGTLLLRGVFPNPDGLIQPGMFARVRTSVAQRKSALLVPQIAIAFDQQGSYVLVVNEKKLVERRGVTIGAQVDDLRVIEGGLKGDEWVVVNGMLKAIPGREVTPEKESPAIPQDQGNAVTQMGAQGRRSAP